MGVWVLLPQGASSLFLAAKSSISWKPRNLRILLIDFGVPRFLLLQHCGSEVVGALLVVCGELQGCRGWDGVGCGGPSRCSALLENVGFPHCGCQFILPPIVGEDSCSFSLSQQWALSDSVSITYIEISLWFAFAFLIPNKPAQHLRMSYWAVWVSSTMKCPWLILLLDFFFFDSLWILNTNTFSL